MNMFKKIVLMLGIVLAFGACSKDIEVMTYEKQKKYDFEKTFNTRFGTPAKEHTWGFADAKVMDFTEKASTRGHDVNGNMWYQKWARPVNVTDAEREKVVAEFSKVRNGVENTISIPWENYWVQQVHQGTSASVDGTGTRVYPSGVMNRLMAYNFNDGQYEHVNNFNNANNETVYTDDITQQKYIGTTLMINMGTGDKLDQFAYHNTSSSDYYYSYIVLEIDGAYYVGFDIVGYHPVGQDDNANMDVTRDWVFNDWIVKISPAEFAGMKRIIAEDLAAEGSSDFDYNDVVFDAVLANEWVANYPNQWGGTGDNRLVAHIVLRAAGGTMPLYIGDKEVHSLFGVDTGKMVNTNNGTIKKAPVMFSLDLGPADWSNSKSIKDIPVVVKTNKGDITLGTEVGKASEKLCVNTDFQWCDERDPIDLIYPDFKNWVREGDSLTWY